MVSVAGNLGLVGETFVLKLCLIEMPHNCIEVFLFEN